MRFIGFFLVLAGVVAMLYAASMDVTVTTEPQNIGGVEIEGQTVNNLGLMDQRRNTLLIGAVVLVAGIVLVAVGYATYRPPSGPGGVKVCPNCSGTIAAAQQVCHSCNYDFRAANGPPERARVYADGNICPQCGSDLTEGAHFCGECGAELLAPPPQNTASCPSCGQSVDDGDRFCRGCGLALAGLS